LKPSAARRGKGEGTRIHVRCDRGALPPFVQAMAADDQVTGIPPDKDRCIDRAESGEDGLDGICPRTGWRPGESAVLPDQEFVDLSACPGKCQKEGYRLSRGRDHEPADGGRGHGDFLTGRNGTDELQPGGGTVDKGECGGRNPNLQGGRAFRNDKGVVHRAR